MSAIAPNSDLILLKCPIEEDQRNQLTFASVSAQTTYFNGLTKLSNSSFTYQRKDGIIRYPAKYDDICEYNYVMYKNTSYGSKWFYAFITKMEYINDGMTAISIKTDVYQTWMFNFVYKRSFVEREHVNDDTIGAHLLPEPVDLGEMVISGTPSELALAHPSGTNPYRIIAGVSDLGPIESVKPSGFDNIPIYNNIPSGLTYIVLGDASCIERLAKAYDQDNKASAIYSIFLVPYASIDDTSISWYDIGGVHTYGFLAALLTSQNVGTITLSRPGTLNGYTPRNNKLKTAPYCYCFLSNNAGGVQDYHYEDFTGGSASFGVTCAIGPGCSTKAVPSNYMGQTAAYSFGLAGQKLPTCGWVSDSYTNWLTQNAVNYTWDYSGLGSALSGLGTALGMAVGGPAGAMIGATGSLSLINSVTNATKSETQAKLLPDQARGDVSVGNVNWSNDKCSYTLYPMSIKYSYAAVIDQFFDMFGYKQNTVKVPNITGRSKWNYVKTVGANVEGNVPQDDLNEFKQMLDRGITFWHDASKYLDYSQTNSIVTP